MKKTSTNPKRFVTAIADSKLTIHDPIEVGDNSLWIPSPELQSLLDKGLRGCSLTGLPLRTRSKIIKEHICRILGYPVPKRFTKARPRFSGQQFDTYIQKSNNLQIWNEELSPSRRYVIIRVSESDVVTNVRVVTGDSLAKLDTTGTLTQKYQARCIPGGMSAELVTPVDTDLLQPLVSKKVDLKTVARPTDHPQLTQLLPIQVICERLKSLIGKKFPDTGRDQERNRGAALHRLVCTAIGYAVYQDDGRFPDIRHQLLEVKLQTSPTIDLGLVTPRSQDPLDVPQICEQIIRHCDVRYAVFCGQSESKSITLTHLIVTTGEAFLSRFPLFQGKVLNKKLQIPLPADFFGT